MDIPAAIVFGIALTVSVLAMAQFLKSDSR